jgi:hypothetical protein
LYDSAKTLVTTLVTKINVTQAKVYYIFLKKSTVFVLVGYHGVHIRENSGTDNNREVAPGRRIGFRDRK